jgi:hypothetical protein
MYSTILTKKIIKTTNIQRSTRTNKYYIRAHNEPEGFCCGKDACSCHDTYSNEYHETSKDVLLKTIEIKKNLRRSIEEAKNICSLIGNTIDCIVAWDAVSDISTGYYANKEKEIGYTKDPLAEFCDENPDDEQCKEYDV